MVWCDDCQAEVEVADETADGFSCCTQCGKVLEDGAFATDVTFVKGAGGDTAMAGQYVSGDGTRSARFVGGRMYGQQESHERTAEKGRLEIENLAALVSLPHPRDDLTEPAMRLYKLALQHQFTRGRRVDQVAGACIYTVCRMEGQPFMLIDFSDALQVNVFTLGAVFLQLVQLLRMQEQPFFSRPIDPSLYLDRFAKKLGFGSSTRSVVESALHLVASMKRDWMHTGRRPSGICGAALYLAAHIHGLPRTKREIIAVVHIGEHTLHKRMMEFAATSAAEMVADEFQDQSKAIEGEQAKRLEAQQPSEEVPEAFKDSTCEHVSKGVSPHFVHGMCAACYSEFLSVSGGVLPGSSNPPAYSKNRKKESDAIRKRQLALSMQQPGYDEEEEAMIKELETALVTTDLLPFTKALPEGERPLALPAPPEPSSQQQDESASLATTTQQTSERRVASGAAATTSSTPQLQGPVPHDWAGEEDCVRAWVAAWLDFEPDAFTSNADLLRSYLRHCSEQQQPDGDGGGGGASPSRFGGKSSRDIRFASFLEDVLRQLGRRFRCPVRRGFSCGARGFHAVALRDERVPAHEIDAAQFGAAPLEGELLEDEEDEEEASEDEEAEIEEGGAGPQRKRQRKEQRQVAEEEEEEAGALRAEGRQRQGQGGEDAEGRSAGGGETAAATAAASAGELSGQAGALVPYKAGSDAKVAGEGGGEESGGGGEGEERAAGEAEGQQAEGKELYKVLGGGERALVAEEPRVVEDSLSDLEDEEIDRYIHTEEEAQLKELIWMEMNREYLELQEAKQAAQAAADKAEAEREAAMGGGGKKRRKRAPRKDLSADTAAQAAINMLQTKRLSKKVNYDALKELFGGGTPAASAEEQQHGGGGGAGGGGASNGGGSSSLTAVAHSHASEATDLPHNSSLSNGAGGGGGGSINAAPPMPTASATASLGSLGGLGGGSLGGLSGLLGSTAASSGHEASTRGGGGRPRLRGSSLHDTPKFQPRTLKRVHFD